VISAEENIVYRINNIKPDYQTGWIVDLLTLPGRMNVLDSLVKDAIDFFDDYEVNTMYCMTLKGHPYTSILAKNGFLYNRQRRFRTYRFINPIGDELEDFIKGPVDKIHSVHGDSDYI